MDLLAESHVPKYAQIADILRQRVARGTWRREDRLPTNEDLAAEFGVSRVTVRQAVDLLAREGLLEARQGRGTFVTGAITDNRWLKVHTTLAELAEIYRDTLPEILNVAESTQVPNLRPEDGRPAPRYFHMRRIHSRDNGAYCVISIYLDERIFRRHPERFRTETVIPILAAMRKPAITSAWQTLTIGTADLEVARLLKVPLNSPVAEVRRVFKVADGTVIYLGEVTYRGDAVRIEMDLKP